MAAERVNRVIVALGQMTSTINRSDNLLMVRQLVERAANKGAKMLFLPECFHFLGDKSISSVDIAEDLEESGHHGSIRQYRDLASSHDMWLSLGGWQQRAPALSDSGAKRVCNTHLIIDNTGIVRASYAKVHLFDMGTSIGSQAALRESDYTQAGQELVLVRDTPVGNLGLATCYDVRFPGQFMALRAAGATSFAVPSAFTVPTGQAHWEPLLRARAVEQGCYVFAAAQAGKHNDNPGRVSYGHSMAVDPWGRVVVEAGGDAGPELLWCEYDPASVEDARTRLPVHMHARSDVYTAPVKVC